MTPARGLLEGVSVIDFGAAVAGPYAGSLLAELGATVVKVMHRNDLVFEIKPSINGVSTTYLALNWNKDTLVLDLRSADDHRRAVELVSSCDVVLQNSRRGVMDKLGLSFRDVAECNPGIVYCSISGLPEEDEMSQHPMTDPHMQAYSGLTELFGGERLRYYAVLDVLAGCAAVEGILVALNRRSASGAGAQLVEVSLADAARYLIDVSRREAGSNDVRPTLLLDGDSYLVVGADAGTPPSRHGLSDERSGHFAGSAPHQWLADVPPDDAVVVARLLSDEEVMSDSGLRERGLLRDVQVADEITLTLAGSPWEFIETVA
jgi:crotonobetainyl-CoA:carnitine CoA-transferase CaiB-like acyl-CoA transferase